MANRDDWMKLTKGGKRDSAYSEKPKADKKKKKKKPAKGGLAAAIERRKKKMEEQAGGKVNTTRAGSSLTIKKGKK